MYIYIYTHVSGCLNDLLSADTSHPRGSTYSHPHDDIHEKKMKKTQQKNEKNNHNHENHENYVKSSLNSNLIGDLLTDISDKLNNYFHVSSTFRFTVKSQEISLNNLNISPIKQSNISEINSKNKINTINKDDCLIWYGSHTMPIDASNLPGPENTSSTGITPFYTYI
jgi:hypothetical protein